MLLKVYNVSFSAVAVCTFKWTMVDLLQKQRRLIWLTTPVFDCDRSKRKETCNVQCKNKSPNV